MKPPAELPPHIRVRCTPGEPLIYERSSHLRLRERVLYGAINVAGWLFWLHLWRVVWTALAWSAGSWWLQRHWSEPGALQGLDNFLRTGLPAAVLLCVALLAWALVNWWRFRGPDRRQAVAHPSAEQDALHCAMTATALHQAHRAQRLVAHHDDHGKLVGLEPLSGSANLTS